MLPLILPVWKNALLEERIVRPSRQLARNLNMIVERPKVLHRSHRNDRPLVLLPGSILVVLEEPEGPGVLQRVFHHLFRNHDLLAAPLTATADLHAVHLIDKIAQLVQLFLFVHEARFDRHS
jgi:hypothetical protein